MKESNSDWSVVELQALLFPVSETFQSRACMFPDGVDEICREAGLGGLMDLVNDLLSVPIKVCVASRLEPALQRRLDVFRQLRLQDLTAKDVEIYVRDTLQPIFAHLERTPLRQSKFASTLPKKADRVFLWLHLALRSLKTGLENGDSQEELFLRLEDLLNELNSLNILLKG